MRVITALIMCTASALAGADVAPEGAPGSLLFPNSDFELGTLENWRMDGEAFQYQPTQGDNVKARNKERSAKHAGKYWVGTYERFQGKAGEKAGKSQGDKPVGGLLSTGFIIQRPFITFLVGGGTEAKAEVQLIVGGEVVRRESGNDRPEMRRIIWDLRGYLNQKAMLYIVDKSKKSFGFVNADDFRYYETGASRLLFPNSDFEAGDLSGWTAEGDAFTFQPVKGDNVTVRTGGKRRANQQGLSWIGTLEKFNATIGQKPGDVQGDPPTGVLRSQPFTIDGEKILFRVGGGNGKNVGVRLLVGGEEVRVSRGQHQPEMTQAMWDVAPWKGQEARIEIFDQATKAWGFINADDFRYGGIGAATPVVPGAPVETVTLPETLHQKAAPAAAEPAPVEAMPAEAPAPEPAPAEAPAPVEETMPEETPAEATAPAEPAPEAAAPADAAAPVEAPAEVAAPVGKPMPEEAAPAPAEPAEAPDAATPEETSVAPEASEDEVTPAEASAEAPKNLFAPKESTE